MKINFIGVLIIALAIGAFADRQHRHNGRASLKNYYDDIQPRFGGKSSFLLRKQQFEESLADEDDDEDDDDSEDNDNSGLKFKNEKITDKMDDNTKENLIGFVPVKGQNGDTYLIPQSAIESIQMEYEAAGNTDGAILVPDSVVEVIGQSTSKDGDDENVVVPKEALSGVDKDSVLALVDDGSSNGLGQSVLVLKNIENSDNFNMKPAKKNKIIYNNRPKNQNVRNHVRRNNNNNNNNNNNRKTNSMNHKFMRNKNYNHDNDHDNDDFVDYDYFENFNGRRQGNQRGVNRRRQNQNGRRNFKRRYN